MNITITSNEKLKKLPEFHKIIELLTKLEDGGILGRLGGNCITAADMVQTMLSQVGIQSEIVECQLCIYRRGEAVEFFFVGYDNTAFNGQVDTHMVVVTKTPIPVLIDLSVSHLMPSDRPFVVDSVSTSDPSIVTEHDYGNVKLTYQTKKQIKVPHLHQKTLLTRFTEELELKKTLFSLKNFVWIGVGLGLFNLLMNSILLILKLTL